jgi:UDP-N-acetylmuramate: L-alanyl-gamma-D-glutamyl-meso-diaminopimelate ligase
MIGGFVKNFNRNYQLGQGRYFVVEGDEYDSAFFDKEAKFLHYRPKYAVLTSIEFDHGDIYKNLEQIQEAFQKFVRLIPSDGLLMISGEDPYIPRILSGLTCLVETYGIGRGFDWCAERIRPSKSKEGLKFDVYYHGKFFETFNSPLMGQHNIKNSLAVIGLAHHLQVSKSDIQKGIQSFKGVKRRQEIVGEIQNILIMDDFAHHPTAIRETLQAVKLRYPERRLWAIFEPRSATSRRNFFQKEFSRCFDGAERVVISAPPGMDKIPPEERLDPHRLVKEISDGGPSAILCGSTDEIVARIVPEIRSGDLICLMSSGGFDGIHQKLLRALNPPP